MTTCKFEVIYHFNRELSDEELKHVSQKIYYAIDDEDSLLRIVSDEDGESINGLDVERVSLFRKAHEGDDWSRNV